MIGARERGARVFAVEPDPVNAARLRHNVELNALHDSIVGFEMAEAAALRAMY